MSNSVNQVTLIGNLAKDPEIKTFGNGGKVANLRLLTSESWTDKQSGERKEKTDGHNIVIAIDGLVDVAQKYLKKGTKLFITGKLENRSWEKTDGSGKGYATEVIMRPNHGHQLVILTPKQNGGGQGSGGNQGGDHNRSQGNDNYGGDAGHQGGGYNGSGHSGGSTLDDDIPF